MLARALLQTSLVLWLARQTLQGGVRPQSVSWGRVLPARGVGVGLKPGALGNQYGSKAMKTGLGRHPAAQLGVGSYRSHGLGNRQGLKQGGYGNPGAYVMGVGLGTMPGYGPLAGIGYPGARPGIGLGYPTAQRVEEHKPGYVGGAGNYLGANPGNGGYGPVNGLGQGAYLGGAAGKHRAAAAAAALGQGGYPQAGAGKSNGYGEGAAGHLGAAAGNGYGYENGYNDGYGAGLDYPAELADGAESKAGKRKALGTGGYGGQVQGAYGALGAGLESNGGKYGGGAAQVPYGNAPVIPTGLEGEGGYPYGAQQLSLTAEGAKTSDKYGGAGAGYGAQQTGYGAQLGVSQDALGEQAGKYGGMNGAFGKGHKG